MGAKMDTITRRILDSIEAKTYKRELALGFKTDVAATVSVLIDEIEKRDVKIRELTDRIKALEIRIDYVENLLSRNHALRRS